MIEHTSKPLTRRVLIVDDELTHPTSAGGHAVQGLANELRGRGMEVVAANSCEDGVATVVSDSAIHCVFVNWTLGKGNGNGSANAGNGGGNGHDHVQATELLRTLRSRNAKVPVFLMADRKVAGTVTVEVATLADEFVWTLEDTASFVAGRAVASIDRYLQGLLPPFAAALAAYQQEREY
jgi:arginine decarboxylase